MKSAHTPGPFLIRDANDGGGSWHLLHQDDHETHGPYWTVARVNRCSGSESDANAALFRAAPALLEALRDAYHGLVDAANRVRVLDCHPAAAEYEKRAKAALAAIEQAETFSVDL